MTILAVADGFRTMSAKSDSVSGRFVRRLATFAKQSGRAPVEGDDGRGAKPFARVRDHAIGTVAAVIEHGAACVSGRAIDHPMIGIEQLSHGRSDLGIRRLIGAGENLHQFTQSRNGDRDQLRMTQNLLRETRLAFVILDESAYQHVRIGGDRHGSPTHLSAVTAFMSSIESGRCPSRFSIPETSEIFPIACATRSLISPPGSVSMLIFPPGGTPGCRSGSLRKVICPFEVTVYAFMTDLRSTRMVRGKTLSFQVGRRA